MEHDHRCGDKVAIKGSPTAVRGVITATAARSVCVRTGDDTVEVPLGSVTNFSAAARKAWRKQPHRRVGRPRGRVVDRVTVNIRMDRDLWDDFKAAEGAGLIPSRTEMLNTWLRAGLSRLRKASEK